MQMTTISRGNRYKLTSYAHGWAYCLEDMFDPQTIFVQDDDARDFRCTLESLELSAPDWPVDSVLGYLWNEWR